MNSLNRFKTEILHALRKSNRSVSGQELCNALGISRTAVWKYINQLKEEGYEIEAGQNRGYNIVGYPNNVASWEIESRILGKSFLERVYFFDEVDSTNTKAKDLVSEMNGLPILVVSEKQNAGKGRRGRIWNTPTNQSVLMSFGLRPRLKPSKAYMLTLVAGLAVVKAIRNVTDLEAFIKWPNDIVVNNKKVCGILTEMTAEPDYVENVVVGIGINVNMLEFPEEILHKATSLKIESGKEESRADIIEQIIYEFEKYYKIFEESGNMGCLKEEYSKYLINLNREVTVVKEQESYHAVALRIEEDGELVVRCDDGQEKKIISGEVSVRGVYGYV